MPPRSSDSFEYVDDDAEPGILALWKLSDRDRDESVEILSGWTWGLRLDGS